MLATVSAHKEQRQLRGDAQDYRVLGDDKTTAFSLPHLSLAHGPLRSTTGHPQRRFQDRRRNSLPRFLAATALILSILVIGVICKAAREVPQRQPGSTPRRLASGWLPDESAELCQIAEHCLELETDMGIAQPSAQATAGTESASMIESLVAMLQEAAEAHEQQRTEETKCVEKPEGVMHSSSEGAANPAPTSLGPHLPQLDGDSSARPALIPAPPAISSAGGNTSERSYIIYHLHGGLGVVSPISAIQVEGACSHSALQQFRISSPKTHPCAGHPFVRLPSVEFGVKPRHLVPQRLFLHHRSNLSTLPYMKTLRQLLTRNSLDQAGTETFMDALERLIDIVWTQAQGRSQQRRPAVAVSVLGKDFLAMDFIISAIQLFGEAMELSSWWERFVGGFRTNYYFHGGGSVRPRVRNYNTQLANRLLSAIRIYKQGLRPSLEEVIALKRMLFCSPSAPKPFTEYSYDAWRHDEEIFQKQQLKRQPLQNIGIHAVLEGSTPPGEDIDSHADRRHAPGDGHTQTEQHMENEAKQAR
ncbi:hypothetical protein, conserved [Eimeria tenella]|uniref:Uncharacterized protein n=1 Tax=Eimeria tenella TaxID=5802 RepID=U6KNS2_EIMTE|nr:hypothetical protein, conserved [Eimeria tenella]CDJ37907.1 hypothetical protein, conserved [Eimeria tenella]|eukprot:XP_013228745.1 hypothetical protein, conserved [Eimeria tenella]